MSMPTHLPIYKLCYELLQLSSQAYKQMPRDFKPTMAKAFMRRGHAVSGDLSKIYKAAA